MQSSIQFVIFRDMKQGEFPDIDPERWLEDHGDAMYSFAMQRTNNRTVAEDLVQETLLAAMVAKERFRGDASVRTWLIGILKFKILDHLRSKYKNTESTTDHLDAIFDSSGNWKTPPSAWDSDPAQHMHDEEFREVLKSCLDDLPPNQRTLMVMRAFNDATTDDLCNLLDISTTNLGVLMHRSRHRLRTCLEDHWFLSQERGTST